MRDSVNGEAEQIDVGASSANALLDDLLRAVAETRDRDAFASLFAHYAPRIKSYLIRLGAKPEEAEEGSQETMLTVWKKASLFDPSKSSAGTWIFTIARNHRIDAHRRVKRPEFDPEDPAFVRESDPAPDRELLKRQASERIRSIVADLPREQSDVIALSFFEDKPHGAIAMELGIPLGTVKSRLRLAFSRIRGAMGNETW